MKGSYLAFSLFSDKGPCKNKHLCNISYSNTVLSRKKIACMLHIADVVQFTCGITWKKRYGVCNSGINVTNMYSYAWSCSLCEGRTYFCTGLISRKLCRFLCSQLALLHSVSYFLFLYHHLLCCCAQFFILFHLT